MWDNASCCVWEEPYLDTLRYWSWMKLLPLLILTLVCTREHCHSRSIANAMALIVFADMLIKQTIKECFAGKTLIVIAHRLDTIVCACTAQRDLPLQIHWAPLTIFIVG